VEALIAALPKVELHVHLEGSMQPALLLELASKHGVLGLPASLEEVREWYEFRDFSHFVDVYLAAVQTLRDQQDFALLVEQTAATLAAQNVRYAEVIVTPRASSGPRDSTGARVRRPRERPPSCRA
jgi:aminodeoxyfutalosine deaminase